MASHEFDHFRQPLESIKLATDNFHDQNLIQSSATSSNVEKPFGRLTRLRKCVCLDQCLHNHSQAQDQSMMVYKANVKTYDGSDIFKQDLSITGKKLEEKHIVARKFVEGDPGGVLLRKEFEALCSLEHENLMPVFGVCNENEENIMPVCGVCDKGNDNIIVYRHEATRFLHTSLAEPKLTWKCRLHICLGIASVLKYFHEKNKIIHGNISSSVILLDNNCRKAKLFGFEFNAPIEEGEEDNPGQRNYKTVKSEVYNFGLLLFEIMCGRKENSFAELVTKHFKEGTLDKIIDPALKNQMDKKSLDKFSKTAYDCLMREPRGAPSLAQIVDDLKVALDLQRDFVRLRQPLEHIKLATDNFHCDNLIPSPTKNEDNYGRPQDQLKVYKAKVKTADRWNLFIQDLLITETKLIEKHIAVRKYAEGEKGRVPFLKEFHILSGLKHENIMSVFGVCDEEHENIIVYRHPATKFLHTCLEDSKQLTWIRRLRICVDIASALKYLHEEKRTDTASASALKYLHEEKSIIHGNINSSVILLDDNWNAKLFGFEFSLIRNEEGEEENPIDPGYMGTSGYADPALQERKYMTTNSDVYSFGVLLFEIMCGERVGENSLPQRATRSFEEGELDKIIHDDLRVQMDPKSYDVFVKTAYACMLREPTDRPTIDQIYKNLYDALACQRNIERRRKLKIPLETIMKAIHDFDSAVLIGYGGFSKVYKAKLQPYAGYVAIKRINREIMFGIEGFNLEIDILGRTEHPNIIPLLGFCEEKTEIILITELAINGSLADFLQKKITFTWERRLEVCLGIARGIHHLHAPEPNESTIFHRDIKSDNILMFQNWEVKISDFGLSKERPPSKIGTLNARRVGTSLYTAPECKKLHVVSEKSDVYSFGVVLFEILCGKVAYDKEFNGRQKSPSRTAAALRNLCKFFGGTAAEDRWFNFYEDNGLPAAALRYLEKKKQIEMVDTSIMETHRKDFTSKKGPDEDSLNTFFALANFCLEKDPKKRCKTMKYAIKELEKALFQATLKVKYEEINYLGSEFVGFKNLKRGTFSHLGEEKDVLVKNVESRLPTSLKEVKIPFNYKHKNIIGIIGYGIEELKHMFVYEGKNFKGSLDQYLDKASLTWTKRLKICIGVAEGLKYLHTNIKDQVVVHGDIKSSSIVLDEKWEAKIINFGCSSIRKNNKCTNLKCVATDIFLFGRLLFEVMSGSKISDKEPFRKQFPDRMLFGNIETESVKESLDEYKKILDLCFTNAKDQSADIVLKGLRKALDIQVSKKPEIGTQVQDQELSMEPSEHTTQSIQDPSSSYLTTDVRDLNPNTLTPRSNISMVLDTIKDKAALEIPYEAIKRCRETVGKYQGRKVLLKEVVKAKHSHELNILFNYKHKNIISVIGYGATRDMTVFVYEDEEFKGSLDKYLSDTNLNWNIRLKICINVAKGLNFLHTGAGGVRQDEVVLHGKIRSSAILLQKNWNAKINFFGDSLIKEKDEKTYTHNIVADDIKSFGYLMFEILRGSEITVEDLSEEWPVFSGIRDEIEEESSTTFRKIANRCIREGEKPTAFAVLSKLKKALRTQILLKDRRSKMRPSYMHMEKTDQNIPQTNVPHEAERSNIDSEIEPLDELAQEGWKEPRRMNDEIDQKGKAIESQGG